MSIFWLTPFLLLTLFPTLWKNNKNSAGFIGWNSLKFGIGIFWAWLIQYSLNTDHTLYAFFATTIWLVFASVILDYLYMIFSDTSSRRNRNVNTSSNFEHIIFIIVSFLALTWFYSFTIYPATIANDRYETVNAIEKKDKLETTDIDHIPTVPLETAINKGKGLLGGLQNASYYQLGDFSRQKINNQEYWVAPIEYKSFSRWTKADFVPGYVKISAELKDKPAELIQDFKMKYIPSGFFSTDIVRHVRGEYPKDIILGVNFEPDDSGKPYYVVAIGHYQNYRYNMKVDGAVLVDPQTGEMKKYSLDTVPDFVDFVFPQSVASKYAEWQGEYGGGWVNSWWGLTGVHEPTKWGTGEEVIGVFGPDGKMYWFTDHTTVIKGGATPTSMVGYSLMDGRTGKYTYYTNVNGMYNGGSALDAVHNTFKTQQWSGTNPVLYNIYEQDTWYIPVIDGKGILREIALVNAKNTSIVAHAENKKDALAAYKYKLATEQIGDNTKPTDVVNSKQITGKVLRTAMTQIGGEQVVQLLISGSDKIFNINQTQYPYAAFIRQDDDVQISYIDAEETSVTATKVYDVQLNK